MRPSVTNGLQSRSSFASRSHQVREWGKNMRDIRGDLRERLSSLEERVVQLQASLRTIEDESAVIMRLLDYEDYRFPPGLERTSDEQCEKPVLADFITNELNGRPMEAFAG
jgi:hypothetical protein